MTRIVVSGGRVFAVDTRRQVCIELSPVMDGFTLSSAFGESIRCDVVFPSVEVGPKPDESAIDGEALRRLLISMMGESAGPPFREPSASAVGRVVELVRGFFRSGYACGYLDGRGVPRVTKRSDGDAAERAINL